MKKLLSILAVTAMLAGFGSELAFAQSSGNFSATGTSASCTIGSGGELPDGTMLSSFTASISTGNGNGTTLVIRPSLVTGLFTKTKINTSVPTASADVGIQVCVTVDGSGDNVFPASCVIYDQRFQQISSNLFSQLAECTLQATTTPPTACTVEADCAATPDAFCNNPTGGNLAGICVVPFSNPNCNFELILSTLSAHSFEFVAPVGKGKPHVITASWKPVGLAANNTGNGNSSVATCVGPGILTVTQTKVFHNSGALSFGSN